MYFNTTNETDPKLSKHKNKNSIQEKEILNLFKLHYSLTPSQVYLHLKGSRNYPITSIRRAITDLTTSGKLLKSVNKQKGPYDRFEYIWLINE